MISLITTSVRHATNVCGANESCPPASMPRDIIDGNDDEPMPDPRSGEGTTQNTDPLNVGRDDEGKAGERVPDGTTGGQGVGS